MITDKKIPGRFAGDFSLDLVCQFCLDELSVESGNVGDGFVLRTYCLAGTGVGAVAKSQFLHLGHHGLGALGSLRTSLWEKGQLTHLRTDEEHGRAVLAGSDAGTASDT